jgi:hypothetical protein
MFKPVLRFAAITVCFLSFFINTVARAQGNLFINPIRIVFEGQKRSQEISLANTGTDSARYQVSFVQIRLTENGNFEQIETPDPGQLFADKNLRIFPRIVSLGPKETQVVRVQVYKKEQLQAGEYRSHLYFRALPNKDKPASKLQTAEAKNVSVKIVPVFGITIPVIIRIGENQTTASVTELKIDKEAPHGPSLNFRINRSGNMSVYGDVYVTHISASGKSTQVGFIKGISVYTPNALRNITLKLDTKSNINYTAGKLSLSFETLKDGKKENLASTALTL